MDQLGETSPVLGLRTGGLEARRDGYRSTGRIWLPYAAAIKFVYEVMHDGFSPGDFIVPAGALAIAGVFELRARRIDQQITDLHSQQPSLPPSTVEQ